MSDVTLILNTIDQGDAGASDKIGMHAVLQDAYTNTGKRLPQGARKITYISELPALVERINAGIHP